MAKLWRNEREKIIFQNIYIGEICGGGGSIAGIFHIYYDCKAGLSHNEYDGARGVAGGDRGG